MRNPFCPHPTPEELKLLEVHEILREYPELLASMRELGVRIDEDGTSVLPEGSLGGGEEGGGLLQILAWRGEVGV